MNDRRTCEQCRWWHREEPTDQNGQCRRYPPIAATAHGLVRPTMAEENFCGEWRDKSITPEQEQRAELMERFAVVIVEGIHANPYPKKTEVGDIWSIAELLVDAKPKIGGES